MTDREKELIEKLGLNQSEFEPTEITEKERIEAIEDALAEMMEAIL